MKRLRWLLSASILALWAAGSFQKPATAANSGGWMDISEKTLKRLAAEGKTPAWPGKSAGIAVDRITGDVFMIISGLGVWRSSDRGENFARIDGGIVGGRCETGFALNLDPRGKRLACFMLDGPSGYSLDGGKTWEKMQDNGRGWDAASVEWSAERPANIFALRHESDGEIYSSPDLGKSWKLKGKGFASVGIFDAATFVATKEKEKGIFRSTDGGESWQNVSQHQPAGRDIRILDGTAFWTSSEGLLVSRDAGKTWRVQGAAVDCSFGPYFGNDARHVVVVGKKGIFESQNGGANWAHAVGLPPGFSAERPGWFLNFGWDPSANIFYISKMGEPAYKFQRK